MVAPDVERDTGYCALRCDTLGPGTTLPPANTRFGPDLQAAWKALYDFAGESDSAETLKQWRSRQKAVRDKLGLKTCMSGLGVSGPPSTLDQYLTQVVGPTLESQRKNGAVAIKFEVAYLRSLDFRPVSRDAAAETYARHRSGEAASASDYNRRERVPSRIVCCVKTRWTSTAGSSAHKPGRCWSRKIRVEWD